MSTPLESVQEWQRLSEKVSERFADGIWKLFNRGFETMIVVLAKPYKLESVRDSLDSLDALRKSLCKDDNWFNDPVRGQIYTLMQSLAFTLRQLTDDNEELRKKLENMNSIEAEEASSRPLVTLSVLAGEAMEDAAAGDVATEPSEDSAISPSATEEECSNADEDVAPKEVQDEVEGSPSEKNHDEEAADVPNELSDDDEDEDEKETPMKDVVWKLPRRTMEDDEEMEADEVHNDEAVGDVPASEDENEIDEGGDVNVETKDKEAANEKRFRCFKCSYSVYSFTSFKTHLRVEHDTTMKLSNHFFQCVDCGHQAQSDTASYSARNHANGCPIKHFTISEGAAGKTMLGGEVHGKVEKTLRRQIDSVRVSTSKKVSMKKAVVKPHGAGQKCTQCKEHIKTAHGYIHHVRYYHDKTLKEAGCYLKCECGIKVKSYTSFGVLSEHTKRCGGQSFKVIRLRKEKKEK